MREIGYRVDVIRHGAVLTTLRAVEVPRIDCSAFAEIKMSMSGTFIHDAAVDYLNDELRPVLLIDGVEFPLGVFPISGKTDLFDGAIHHVVIDCYDRGYILKTTRTEEILHIDAGTGYLAAVEQLLVAAGIPLYIATASAETLATDREDWEIGTDYLTIINQLLSEINYRGVWFDSSGYAVLEPEMEPDAGAIDHRYGGEARLLRPGVTSEIDLFAQPNVFIVVCDNPDLEAPLTATAENNNPLSSLSILKRGRRIPQVYKVDNIASQTALDEYAKRLAYQSMLQNETVEIETGIDAAHGIGDVVAVNHPQIEGIYEETAWSMILSAGQAMRHTLRRMIIA